MKNEKGFSLVEVMIAAALLGALAIGGMQVMQNISDTKKSADSIADELELRSAVRLIVDSERNCRISIAGEGPYGNPTTPVTFKKKDQDETHEGIPVNLWLSDQKGLKRSVLRFQTGMKFDNLTIKSIRLVMNNGVDFNYLPSTEHSDMGQLLIDFEKKVGSKNKSRFLTMDFALDVTMETDASGNSTILSCSSKKSVNLTPMYSRCEPADSGTDSGDDNQWHSSLCRPDLFITKIQIYASERLDGPLQQVCCKIKSQPGDGTPIIKASPTTGSSDDEDHAVNCDQDMFMTGYDIYSSDRLDGPVKIQCQAIRNIAAGVCNDFPGTVSNMDNTIHMAECPYGTVMAGVNFHASSRLDNIKSIRCCEIRVLD